VKWTASDARREAFETPGRRGPRLQGHISRLELATVPEGHVFAPSKKVPFLPLLSGNEPIPHVLFLLCITNKYDLIIFHTEVKMNLLYS
jgi:hypothetical protein